MARTVLILQTGPVAERVRVREIDDDEVRRLVRIVRRDSGSVVTWRRAQMVLLSAQGMDVAGIAKVAFTSEDRVRDVIRNFNADGFGSLYPKYRGGRAPKFTLVQRREIKKIAKSRPVEHDLPFSWSLSKLAEFLVAEGVVDDISHEGLRLLLREEGVPFQVIKTWKQSTDPDFETKKNRVLELYDIADGKATPKKGDPKVVICMDEFGPLNLLPRPGKQWAPVAVKGAGATDDPRRRRRRATFTRHAGVRHLMAAYDLNGDKIYGHIKTKRTAPPSSSSAATCAASTHRRPASPSCSTTSAPTCRRRRTAGWATGPRPTMSSWPMCPPTQVG